MMNDRVRDRSSSSRGVPHAEASADIGPANPSAELNPSEQVQVPQSPQPLSLQVDTLNDRLRDHFDSTGAYVESSERGSDTSVDGQQPELQSASTFTDSVPSSSLNDSTRSMELDGFQAPKEDAQAVSTSHKPPASQDPLCAPVNANGTIGNEYVAVKAEEQSHDSLPPLRSPSQFKSGATNGTHFTPGHKRTATGDIKSVSSGVSALHSSDLNRTRRRSKSTGASTHGSRIAQLSVHIRTRLSYAAAKIEKSRQSQDASTQLPFRGLENLSSRSPPVQNSARPLSDSPQHQTHTSSTDTPRLYLSHQRSQSAIPSPGKIPPIPKLAPPVDIITSSGDTRRRRPHPNMDPKPFDHTPYGRHRRHNSHQEPPATRLNGSPRALGPGTPTFTPSSQASASQGGFYRPRTHSENTSMEQDAIETLLFMSSPENSGYRSSPRPLQPPATQDSLNASLSSSHNGGGFHPLPHSRDDKSQHRNGQSQGVCRNRFGMESRAGDEIDRLLDQMDSDSEDEGRYTSHRRGVARAGRRHHG